MKLLFLLSLAPLAAASTADSDGLAKRVLDLMQRNFTDGEDFPADRWERMAECDLMIREATGLDTLSAMDSLFEGFVQWGGTNGTDGSAVPQPTDDGADAWNQPQNYQENFLSPMAPDNT